MKWTTFLRRHLPLGQRYPFFGDCSDCGHDWREHIAPAVSGSEPCSECDYKIKHGEVDAPAVACRAKPSPNDVPPPRRR